MVFESHGEYESQWAAITSISGKVGCTAEIDKKIRNGLTTDERKRLKEPEREVKEFRTANEILRKASAYFAQAELDRRPK